MTLGQLMKDSRARLGLSLRDVERETGISNGHLSLLESGTVQRPSPNLLEKLASLYGVSYSLLMELSGYRSAEPITVASNSLGEMNDLSELELEQVRRFVGYLRSTRTDDSIDDKTRTP
ncbi:MAG: helix-turn-helix domain protein [Gemmatimonadetes bacterium]|nr:helix-turn-helix domain protein [Gemmatimonadota bacterium]